MGKGYDKSDAVKDTDTSSSKVNESWHQARDDSGARSGKDKGRFDKAPGWAKDSSKGPSFFPKGKNDFSLYKGCHNVCGNHFFVLHYSSEREN